MHLEINKNSIWEEQIVYEDNHILVLNKLPSEIVQGDKTGDLPLSEKIKHFIKKLCDFASSRLCINNFPLFDFAFSNGIFSFRIKSFCPQILHEPPSCSNIQVFRSYGG